MTVNSLTTTNTELRHRLRERKLRWELLQASWIDALGLIVPMAAPLVPAFLTATAIVAYYPALLGLDVRLVIAIAIVAGSVIEILGIISIETMFDMRSYNETAQEGEETAPFQYAAAAVAFYLLLVISLVLLLKIWHGLALWSLAPLTILGFITSWVMVLRKQHGERVYRREAKQTDAIEQMTVERLNAAMLDAEQAFKERLTRAQDDYNRAHVALIAEQENKVADLIEKMKTEHATQLEKIATDQVIATTSLRDQLALLTTENERLTRLANRSESVQRPTAKRSEKGRKTVQPEVTEADKMPRVLEFFTMYPGGSMREAAAFVACSAASINTYAAKLVEQGKLRKDAHGKYHPIIKSDLTIPMFDDQQIAALPTAAAPTTNGFHAEKAGVE